MRFIGLLFIFIHFNAWTACPEFETALQKAAARFEARVAAPAEKQLKQTALSTPEVISYKAQYSKDFKLPPNSNREFMTLIEADAKAGRSDVIYFDAENSIQKKLNDYIFEEKIMVDSVNNSFMEKLHKRVFDNPELKARLSGQYKDYKSLRFRLKLKPGESREKYENMLADAYKKSVQEFKVEFDRLNLKKLLNPRTDTVPDVEQWFLAGSGETPIAANMAARGARSTPDKGILRYTEHIDELHKDVLSTEELRLAFSNDARLVEIKVLESLPGGQVIPSKDMIKILRKIKPSDCRSKAEYLKKIHVQVKKSFGSDISDETIADLTNYFAKVDSLSPPIFSRERVQINLGEAKNGIVSIDFTGVGVDNAYQQMSALARLNYKEANKALFLKEAFGEVQSKVDQVTIQMNNSKRYFSSAVKKVNEQNHAPMFSGDDGIFMPKSENWTLADKKKLIHELGKSEDPSKYRVTFVKSQYANGVVVPAPVRSKLIVRAESFEKNLRDKITGVEGISSEETKKIITAIDFSPNEKGGSFRLLIAGKSLTSRERKIIEDAAKKSIDSSAGEIFSGLDVVNGN